MKISCTKREYEALYEHFLYLADCSKVATDSCPIGHQYCMTTPMGDIKPPMCRQCYVDNIIWEIEDKDD